MLFPLLLLLTFALTRIPGMMPPNFSAAYGLAFCAGAFFLGWRGWVFTFGTLLITDLALNSYYFFVLNVPAFHPMQLINYGGFALLLLLGRGFSRQTSWLRLTLGGLAGSVLFYLITNTASWFFNPFAEPEYTKNLSGWITALTRGTSRWSPSTLEFFRNTLISGGLFTALFAATKLALDPKPAREEEQAEGGPEDSPAPEENEKA